MCLSLSSPFPLFPQPQAGLLSLVNFLMCLYNCTASSPVLQFFSGNLFIAIFQSMSARVNCFDFLNIATVNIR